MADFVLCKNNYYTSKTISSTSGDAEYPVTNLAKRSRSYVWRSSPGGYYYITSANNKIDFNEGAGSLVATVTANEYTATTLCTEIKTRLDAAGGDTYTVTFSESTGKFTIESDGATFELEWNTGANKANSIADTIGFDDAADDTGDTEYTGDNIAIHTSDRLVLDLGDASTDIDTFALFFDLMNDVSLSDSATVTLKGHTANTAAGWASPSASQAITIDTTAKNAFYQFGSTQTYRYWAIEIVDPANSNLYVQLDCCWIGEDLGMSQPPSIGFEDVIRDQSKVTDNEFGHEYWDEYPQRRVLNLSWGALSETDKNILRNLFISNGNSEPIIAAFDTGETIFSDMNQHLIYGRLRGNYKGKHVFSNFFDAQFKILEAV